MKMKQKGFTLIELIVVIVVLGILAVFAAPKYLSFTKDAARASVEGVGGAIESVSELYFGKAVVANVENESQAFINNVQLTYGYPVNFELASQLKLDDRFTVDDMLTGTTVIIAAPGYTPTITLSEACQVTYEAPTFQGARPTVTYELEGCDKDTVTLEQPI